MSQQDLSTGKKVTFSVIVILVLVLVVMAVGEVGVRIYGSYEDDGNFYVGNARLKPYRDTYPRRLEGALAKYLANTSPWTAYDAELGWAPSPNGQSPDGLHEYDSAGIRSDDTEYTMSPKEGVLRIALFGDSFTEGAEVPFESTWGHYLEKNLNEAGIPAEVINFGASAHGMDQALLRWRKTGHKYSPDAAIFGFQAENAKRNLNIFRGFYNLGSGVIFTKPRFILDSSDLRLINVPTVPPGEIKRVIDNFGAWELAEYENFYDRGDFKDSLWRKSKLLSFTENRLEKFYNNMNHDRAERQFYQLDNEGGRLAMAIIDEFREEVDVSGAEFIVVHLPKRRQITSLSEGRALDYAELLEELDRTHIVIDPSDDLVEEYEASSLEAMFMQGGHPSDRANQIIAANITEFYIQQSQTNN